MAKSEKRTTGIDLSKLKNPTPLGVELMGKPTIGNLNEMFDAFPKRADLLRLANDKDKMAKEQYIALRDELVRLVLQKFPSAKQSITAEWIDSIVRVTLENLPK